MITFLNIIGLLVLLANPWLLLAPLPALALLLLFGIIAALVRPLLQWEHRSVECRSGVDVAKWAREQQAARRQLEIDWYEKATKTGRYRRRHGA